MREIALLPYVKMLQDADEYSEFEAIFANSRELNIITKKVNFKVQDLVANIFDGINFDQAT